MTQVLMREERDCGIAAIATATDRTYEQVLAVFDELDGNWRDDLNDSPLHHENALRRLKIPSKVVGDDEILRGGNARGRVVVLVHNNKSPNLMQHWCVVEAVTPEAVLLLWGSPTCPKKLFTRQEFKDLYRKGFPNCAYEVFTGKIRGLPWYSRFWVWLTSWL